MSETVVIEARLVGDVTGTVYAQNVCHAQTIYKDPELYVGEMLMAIPFHPVPEHVPPWPTWDPEDTAVKLQIRTNSAATRFGRSPENPFPYIGHWVGWVERRPGATIEIPNGVVS